MSDTAIIDTLYYKASMHHALLNNVEGLSLERTSEGFWQSASTIIRATPGYENTRASTMQSHEPFSEKETENFKLLSSTAHIYNTEYPENVILLYRLHEPQRVTVKVFSLNGYPVYTILESELLSGEGRLYWDGRGDNFEVLPVGLYVILVEIYSETASYSIQKLPVAVIL